MARLALPHDRREIAAIALVALLGAAVGIAFFLLIVRAFGS